MLAGAPGGRKSRITHLGSAQGRWGNSDPVVMSAFGSPSSSRTTASPHQTGVGAGQETRNVMNGVKYGSQALNLIDSRRSANSVACERNGEWSLSISTTSSQRWAICSCTSGRIA